MTQTKYQLGPTEQLIDLNDDLTNYELKFTVKTVNGAPFHGAVVNQAQISAGEFDYKNCPMGEFGATLVADKDVYQNYFLALKSDKPCECTVEIDKKEIPPAPKPPAPKSLPSSMLKDSSKSNETSIDWKLIALFVVILGGGVAAYYFVGNKSGKDDSDALTAPLSPDVAVNRSSMVSFQEPAVASSFGSAIPTPPVEINTGGLSLLDRLNAMEV